MLCVRAGYSPLAYLAIRQLLGDSGLGGNWTVVSLGGNWTVVFLGNRT